MRRHHVVALVSAAQLGFQLAGLRLAVDRKLVFDFPGWRGDPARVERDALSLGTAVSAPGPMIVAQAISTALLARRDSPPAQRVVGRLGLAMMAGYLIERHVRHRLTRGGWERLESPLIAGGWGLAAGMAYVGHRRR